MNLSDDAILERIQQIVAETLRLPRERVTSNSRIRDDLGAESLDFVDIEAGSLVGLDAMPRVNDWMERALARPASQKALNIPPRP